MTTNPPNKKTRRRLRPILIGLACAVLVFGLLCGLFLAGALRLNTPSRSQYPVWGIDVSEYQGDIDWQVLASQGVRFAFIKATEGSSYTDPYFACNRAGAQAVGIPAGAYHFFSFDSPAQTQAENFITALGATQGMLPPVVDVELYGTHKSNPPSAEAVRTQLDELLTALRLHTGVEPILYATGKAYRLYLAGHFPQSQIWIRDVYFHPSLPDERDWVFWQYSDKGRLEGYRGEEAYIDLNVFSGGEDDWTAWLATFRVQ